MQSTPLAFVDKCHECDDDRDPEEERLTIGRCESAWLADPVGAHILTLQENQMLLCAHRDDSTAAFNNKRSCGDTLKWRTKFQISANRLTGGNCHNLSAVCGWTSQEERH